MTDKAKRRRRALASELGVSTRTAANIIAYRRRQVADAPRGPLTPELEAARTWFEDDLGGRGVAELEREPANLSRASLLARTLHALVIIDREWLQSHPSTPAFYEAGVRLDGGAGIAWRDVGRVLSTGRGGLADLVAWRVAELELAGEQAAIEILEPNPGRGVTLQIRRADGSLEDVAERFTS